MSKARNDSVRERLLAVAIEQFSTRGYAATSTREIVEEAGVTKPALYYHFESKEGLYRATLELVAHKLDETVARSLATPGPALERLERLFADMWTVFERNKPAVRFLNSVFWGPKQGVPPFDFRVLERTFHSALQDLVSEGIASGELRRTDPADAGRVLAAVLSHAMDLALVFPQQAGGKAGLRRALDIVLQGLTPRAHPETAP